VRSQLNARSLADAATMTAPLPYPSIAFAALESFDLVWRWTSPTHAVFPPEVMALIRPFTTTAARTINSEALTRVPLPLATGDESIACGEIVPVEEISTWLTPLSIQSSAWTVLSWNKELAVLVPWSVFADRWSDFCYPASDDVLIWQPGREWTLVYEHQEWFQYFRHRAARVV
jgi:hypothetical protein